MHHIYELSMFHCLNFFFKDCFVNVRQSFVFTFVTKRSRLTKPKFMTLGMCGLIISIRDSESHLVKSCYFRIVFFRTEIPQTLTVGHSWQTRQPHIYNDSLTDGLAWYKTPEVLKFTASQRLFFLLKLQLTSQLASQDSHQGQLCGTRRNETCTLQTTFLRSIFVLF